MPIWHTLCCTNLPMQDGDIIENCTKDSYLTVKSQHEHLENLNEVLNRLSQAGLCLWHEKCTFIAHEVECLGHQISCQGILLSPSKSEAIANASMPQNISELSAFLGMLTDFGNFLLRHRHSLHWPSGRGHQNHGPDYTSTMPVHFKGSSSLS